MVRRARSDPLALPFSTNSPLELEPPQLMLLQFPDVDLCEFVEACSGFPCPSLLHCSAAWRPKRINRIFLGRKAIWPVTWRPFLSVANVALGSNPAK